MSDLVIALLIPTVLWGALILWSIAIGRTWFDVLLVLAGIWLILLLVGTVASGREALIGSVILHVFLAVASAVSFVRFYLGEKRKNRD